MSEQSHQRAVEFLYSTREMVPGDHPALAAAVKMFMKKVFAIVGGGVIVIPKPPKFPWEELQRLRMDDRDPNEEPMPSDLAHLAIYVADVARRLPEGELRSTLDGTRSALLNEATLGLGDASAA